MAPVDRLGVCLTILVNAALLFFAALELYDSWHSFELPHLSDWVLPGVILISLLLLVLVALSILFSRYIQANNRILVVLYILTTISASVVQILLSIVFLGLAIRLIIQNHKT